MSKIKTAIIPVAGTGTRFLPVTKSIPKEMLPILNIPTLHLIIKEAYNAGITKLIIVYSKKKTNIKEYFEVDENFNKKSDDLNSLSQALLNVEIE
jgi:UTP--glucose-1-phosphate uridylyltransferase